MTRKFTTITAIVPSVTLLVACSASSPLTITIRGPTYMEEEISRGVVNGLWQYDPVRNAERLQGMFAGASPDDAKNLAARYQVHVGLERGVFFGRFAEVVVLPEGWIYSIGEVVDDDRTINIGDVVDIRGKIGTNLELVEAIVRKCNKPPLPAENRDWNIGCKTGHSFDSRGYGGEKYYWTTF